MSDRPANLNRTPDRAWNKVFEIGVQRTGTSSLGEAYRLLGLRTAGWNERLYWQCIRGGFDETVAHAADFDAFEDLPWDYDPVYPHLDAAYPGSKFILLLRDDDDWLDSYQRSFGIEDSDFAVAWKRRKYESIRNYFADRPDDLLEMDLVGGQGWETLCPFLGLPVPSVAFPHRNRERAERPDQASSGRGRLGRLLRRG